MLNIPIIISHAHDINLYNDAYQMMTSICFEKTDNKDKLSQILFLLQKKLVLIAKETAIFNQYPLEFVNGINQLNQIVKKYNTTYPNSSIALLPLPPRPQLFESIPTPLKSITQTSDLGIKHDWGVTALKAGSIATGIACNLVGMTAGRYGMQAANTLLHHTVAEVMVQDMIENAFKAAALGSLNGAVLIAPFIGSNALIMDATAQKLCERYSNIENENQEDEIEWEYVEPGIQIILSTAAQTTEQHGDPVSACLFDDLYALNSWSYLLTQETYDDSEVLAVVQTLEYLTYYFTIFSSESKRILYSIINSYYVNIFKDSEHYPRLQTLQTICEPESLLEKVAERAVSMIAFPGYGLIDWNRMQHLRANPPKELLEKLAEIRQYNKGAITQLRAMNYKQYHAKLLLMHSENKPDPSSDLALRCLMRDLSSNIAFSPLLQRFSNSRLSNEADALNTNEKSVEPAEKINCNIT